MLNNVVGINCSMIFCSLRSITFKLKHVDAVISVHACVCVMNVDINFNCENNFYCT